MKLRVTVVDLVLMLKPYIHLNSFKTIIRLEQKIWEFKIYSKF